MQRRSCTGPVHGHTQAAAKGIPDMHVEGCQTGPVPGPTRSIPNPGPGPYTPKLTEFINYRHPDPRHGEPRVCSTQLDAFPEDPLQNSGRLILKHPSRSFDTFGRKMGTHFDTNLKLKALSLVLRNGPKPSETAR